MPLIKAREIDTKVMQAEVLRLQDVEAEAATILAAARKQADAILAGARDQGEKLKTDARKAGMDTGRTEGFQIGTDIGKKQALEKAKVDFAARHSAVATALATALQEFETRRRGLLSEMERDVVALAGAIASRVVKAAVAIDPSCVTANIREALQLIADKNGLEIRLHPADLDQAQQFAHDLLSGRDFEAVRFVADETVGRGGAVLRTAGGQVDTSIETQWIRILDEILAGWKEHWLLGPAMMRDVNPVLAEQEPEFIEIVPDGEPGSSDSLEPTAEPVEPGPAKEALGS